MDTKKRQTITGPSVRELRERKKPAREYLAGEREPKTTIAELQPIRETEENEEEESRGLAAQKARQNKYLRHLLKVLPEIALVLDTQLRVVLCSDNYVEILGLDSADQILGKCPYKDEETYFGLISGMDLKSMLLELMENREPFSYEMELSFKEGDPPRNYRMEHIPLYDEAGGCDGLIISFTDIHTLTHAIKEAQEANKAKSDFLATMSHEIRTPMNAVKGLSELLSLTELDAAQRNYLSNIISASNSLLDIINDILDFSKISADRIDFVEEPYQLDELVSSVCNVTNVKAEDKGLLLTIDAPPHLPRTLVGDDFRIKQILTNILTNAVKYTNKGFVRLSLDVERGQDGAVLVCAVQDSGVGVRAQDLPTLFDAFSRADPMANRNIAGTGLGLSITKQLAQAMGGDIEVQSVYGEGSVFTVRLPQGIADETPIARVEAPGGKKVLVLEAGRRAAHILSMLRELGVEASDKIPLDADLETAGLTHCIFDDSVPKDVVRRLRQRIPACRFGVLKDIRHAASITENHETVLYTPLFIANVAAFVSASGRQAEASAAVTSALDEMLVQNTTLLVVDDNEINRVVSSEMLGSFGAEVVCAEDGFEAVELCRHQKYDIIFMDHMMPGKDGVETTLEIRAGDGPNRGTPILALTANVINDMRSFYLENGMNDCIAKPMDLADLAGALARFLPQDKVVLATGASKPAAPAADKSVMSQQELLDAMDNFGLYASDVMRDVEGDFGVYIQRMDEASGQLGPLVAELKREVSETQWPPFAEDVLRLRRLLYGIGARDCAARAKKLSQAALENNASYIYEDFYSLMGNMYMLEQKLTVLVPVAQGANLQELPLNIPQYLHGCLEKLGRALAGDDTVEAMTQIAHTAAFSLDMELDMVLKSIKAHLEEGDFEAARQDHRVFFHQYTQSIAECAGA